MEDFADRNHYTLDDFIKIMHRLRAPDGCPWDRVQTHQSIRQDILEECYELAEGIDADSPAMMREELGDVLLHVVFHSIIEEEKGNFDFSDVVNDIAEKMVVRHPHVFSDGSVENIDDLLMKWDEIKKQTKGQETDKEVLESVSKAMPALMRGRKVLKKSEKLGHPYSEDPLNDMKILLQTSNLDNEADMARLLMLAAELSYRNGIDAERVLADSVTDFIEKNY